MTGLPAVLPAALLAAAAGYVLGSLSTGYYLVRWRTGEDLRRVGSGTAGATNAGRILGTGGYVGVALLDLAKGAAAVALGAWIGGSLAAGLPIGPGAGPAGLPGLGAPEVGAVAGMVAAVAGHIWPPQLGFRGGKGVATAFGGVLVFRPAVALLALAAFVVVFAPTRRYRLSGVTGVALAPAIAWWRGNDLLAIAGISAVVALVLFAQWLRRRPPERGGATA